MLRGEISFKDLDIGDIEIIQHHHRTVCAWGSTHASPDGCTGGSIPPGR